MSDQERGTRPQGDGYDLARELTESPSAADRDLAGWCLVARQDDRPQPANWILAGEIGPFRLFAAPLGEGGPEPGERFCPAVAARRGGAGRAPVGIDDSIVLQEAAPVHFACPAPPSADELLDGLGLQRAHGLSDGAHGVRIAVIDDGFGDRKRLGSREHFLVGLRPLLELRRPALLPPHPDESEPWADAARPFHGTVMAAAIARVAPRATIGLFELPRDGHAASLYLAPCDLAIAVADAVGRWQAEVVLIAMSCAYWGCPPPLRGALKAAYRHGGQGAGGPRGAVIVCSVGDPAVNSSQEWSSAALPAGDLASQPGVLAVAACEADGSWYRHRRGSPYNRLGPSVALTAPGDWHDLGAGLGADDSSLAAAVVAGIAALVRGRNRTLLAGEIGELLRTTARFPDRVDAGAGPEAGRYNRRDRLGHNFKVGHGRVDALGALLAAGDPVAAALLLTLDEEVGPSLALAWERGIAWDAPIAVAYRAVRGELARRFSCHLELREALLWLTRHLGAIAGASRHSWLAGEGDHGALVERILDLLELVAALPGIPGIQDWAAAARVTIEESGGPGVVGWIGQLLPAVEAAR